MYLFFISIFTCWFSGSFRVPFSCFWVRALCAYTWTFILFSLSHFHGDTWSVSREKNLSPLRPLKSLMYEVLKRLPFWCWDNPAIVIFVYHLNHARGHNSYNDTELGHVFGPSGVDIQIILDRFGKKNNMVSGLLFFLGLVWVCTNSWRSRWIDASSFDEIFNNFKGVFFW